MRATGRPAVRRHLTPDEAARVIEAAGEAGRQPTRDKTLLLLTYTHGLRAAEASGLHWHDVDWQRATLHVERVKGGNPGTHPIPGQELRLLRTLHREAGKPDTGFLLQSERGGPMSIDSIQRICERAGIVAGIGLKVHPHMLRHACGFYLANKGIDTRTIQDYLGHRNISSTVIYTALAETKFRNLFSNK